MSIFSDGSTTPEKRCQTIAVSNIAHLSLASIKRVRILRDGVLTVKFSPSLVKGGGVKSHPKAQKSMRFNFSSISQASYPLTSVFGKTALSTARVGVAEGTIRAHSEVPRVRCKANIPRA